MCVFDLWMLTPCPTFTLSIPYHSTIYNPPTQTLAYIKQKVTPQHHNTKYKLNFSLLSLLTTQNKNTNNGCKLYFTPFNFLILLKSHPNNDFLIFIFGRNLEVIIYLHLVVGIVITMIIIFSLLNVLKVLDKLAVLLVMVIVIHKTVIFMSPVIFMTIMLLLRP